MYGFLTTTFFVLIWFVSVSCSRLIDDGTYWASEDGEYHHSNCLWVNEYNIEDSFESEKEALEAGYEPCWWCISEDDDNN